MKMIIIPALSACLLTGPVIAQNAKPGSASNSSQSMPSQSETMPKHAAGKVEKSQAMSIIGDWPSVAKQAANDMIDKYGAPDEATASMLIWHTNGPWKRTIVYKEEIDHDFPKPHKDVLEQFINYEVPAGKFDELAAYDGSVIAERTKGEISARCDKEGANFLALNLAHDIVQGKKCVEQARQTYTETMKKVMAGEKPELTQKLTFTPPKTAGDSDKAVMKK